MRDSFFMLSFLLAVSTIEPGIAEAKRSPGPARSAVDSPTATTKRVDVGHGRMVAFHITPGRLPAILFVAGGGMDASAWVPLLSAIEQRTGAELITVDRAGFGDSDEDPRPTRFENEAADLKAGLVTLGLSHGVVLVAHSYGGEVATALVNANPGLVARAVLVDANIPSFFTDAETARMQATFPTDIPTADKSGRTMAALIRAYPTMQHDFHNMRWPDVIPATVIVSEHPPLATPAENAAWTQEHRSFAEEAPNRRYVLAASSGHLVMADRPDVVIDAVSAAYQ